MLTRLKWRQATLIIAIAVVTMLLSCGLGDLAVRQGAIAPPDISVELGSMRVVGITSNLSECPRLLVPGCLGLKSAPVRRIYTLWLFAQRERDSWDQPHITHLLSVQLGR
jgi:hypothetical protein